MKNNYDLTLASSGDGWQGTFALTVALAVEDILSDGDPFDARLTWVLDNGSQAAADVSIIALDRALNLITVKGRDALGGQADVNLDLIRKLEV